jgi:hypothetical protein
MIQSFAEKFYEKITKVASKDYEGILSTVMEKDKFIKALEEEIECYTKDTQAEVGMGIYQIIKIRRKILPDKEVLNILLNVCVGLINKSPECAIEFSKLVGDGYG